jgi:hypothetical protein
MATSTLPPAEVPAATAPPVKRTRKTDAWTTAFLVLTGAFSLWATALVLLTALAIAQPSFLYQDQKTLLKAIGATVVLLLAGYQAFTMGAAMGQLPRLGIRMKYLMRGHRYAGRVTLGLAALIAFFCMVDIGAPLSPMTSAVHGTFGSTAFVAIAAKLALLKWRPALAYDAAPWLGRYAAVAFAVIWATSVLAYYTDIL